MERYPRSFAGSTAFIAAVVSEGASLEGRQGAVRAANYIRERGVYEHLDGRVQKGSCVAFPWPARRGRGDRVYVIIGPLAAQARVNACATPRSLIAQIRP